MAQLGAGAGANGDIFAQDIAKNTQKSVFDLSRITNLTADAGMIIPFDWLETLPDEDYTINAETALETLPTITNILTQYHVRTHWYYLKNSDLWEGFETYITKGRNGKINWTVPQINPKETLLSPSGNYQINYSVPHGLPTYLGIPPKYGKATREGGNNYLIDYYSWASQEHDDEDEHTIEDTYTKTGYNDIQDGVSALPFMAYQSIVKYNYVDQNLLQNNHSLYPEEGDSNWRIPAKGLPANNYINAIKYNESTGHIEAIHETTQQNSDDGIYSNEDKSVSLLQLRYAQYEDDAYTTAIPWPQRGDVEKMETNIDPRNLIFQSSVYGMQAKITNGTETRTITEDIDAIINGTGDIETRHLANENAIYNAAKNTFTNPNTTTGALYPLITTDAIAGTIRVEITANKLRELIAMSVWQERNAQVNGSYNSMIWIHYKANPHAQEHYPEYIGGTSDYVNFGEVISTAETSDNPQGTITAAGKLYMDQQVGKFHSPDYGIIMGILIITPVTTYNTTTQKEFFKKSMEDFYFPEFDNLGAMPILNKEIYTKGETATDNDLFGYAKNRYYWMKTRQNVNRGLFQLPSTYNEDAEAKDSLFSAGTQAREFNSTPELSYQFKAINPRKQRRDWLAYTKEPMFKVQIASKIKAVRPMAYNSQPETFGF